MAVFIGCAKIIGKPKSLVALPLLLSAASFAIIPFFVSWTGVMLFSVSSSLVFYSMILLRQKRESKKQDRRQHKLLRSKISLNKPLAVTVLFFCFMSFFLALRNSNISFIVALIGFFVVSFFVFREILEFTTKHSQYVLAISLVLGLIFLEIAWVLSFWPLESFSLSVILLSIAVALLNMIENAINKTMTRVSVLENIGLIIITTLAVSLTTNWMLV